MSFIHVAIFKLEVANKDGEIRTKHARAGDFISGLLRDRAEVRLDKNLL